MKGLAINLGLATLAILATLVVIEVILQLTIPLQPYAVSPGPNSEYRIETVEFRQTVRTNSLNMREEEIHPRRPDEYRVLFLGDSFTFGLGVEAEDTYVRLLESGLTKDGRKLYAMNAGSRGQYSGAQLAFLRKKGEALDPDLLFVQVFTGNDFFDALQALDDRARLESEGSAKDGERWDHYRAVRVALRRHPIVTLELLWNFLLRFQVFEDQRYTSSSLLLRDYPELEQRAVAEVERGLAGIQKWGRERGIPMVVMIVPYKLQVLARDRLDPTRYAYDKPDRIIREFCQARGIPVLDMLAVYDAMPESERHELYYLRDLHWSVAGQRHAASESARFLESLGTGFEGHVDSPFAPSPGSG
jgi:lysophospholipase L1-like esterase